MNLTSQTSLDFNQVNNAANLDGVGKLTKGSVSYDQEQKIYLDYPEVTNLLYDARKALEANKKIKFVCHHNYSQKSLEHKNFLEETGVQTHPFLGYNLSPFNSIMAPAFAGTTVLGNFTLAQIEAKAAALIHKQLFEGKAVDHFKCTDGISSLATLETAVKAFDIKKNELTIFHVPDNAIKAFRAGKFSPWKYAELEAKESSLGKLRQLDYTHRLISEINVVEHEVTNLDSPIYKVKLGDRWILVVPQSTGYQKINQSLELDISNYSIECLQNNIEPEIEKLKSPANEVFECSLGQAVRVIFELQGADFDLIPEAMFNFEGGCFSSIVTEKSATGRYTGTNSLHEVLKNQWHLQADIAIPWNYISFEKLDEDNQRKALSNENFIVEFEKMPGLRFLECAQAWKRQANDQKIQKLKTAYRNLANLASKKYLMSTKELYLLIAEYFASNDSTAQEELKEQMKVLQSISA